MVLMWSLQLRIISSTNAQKGNNLIAYLWTRQYNHQGKENERLSDHSDKADKEYSYFR